MNNKAVYSKWLISKFPGYCFGSDGELYRLPFKSGPNHYGLRKLKMQRPNRWKINGKWWSKRQLQSFVYLNPRPEKIVCGDSMPF